MDGRVKRASAPSHDAEARSRTAEQAPHVRAQGCASSARPPFGEHRGKSSRHDVGEIVMPVRNGFGYFPRKESSPLVAASGIRTFLRLARWIPAFAGMTKGASAPPQAVLA